MISEAVSQLFYKVFQRKKSKGSVVARYGPWAIIGGGSEGIGGAWADYLAAQKLNVVLIARREDKLKAKQEAIQERFGVECLTVPLDLADPEALDKTLAVIGDRDVGFFVYNAALASVAGFYDSTLENEMRRIRINCQTPFAFCWHFGRIFAAKKRGGIVLMSSGAGLFGCPYFTHYSATKAYGIALAEGLWYELGTHGVDVIAPIAGLTDTPGLKPAIDMAIKKGQFYMKPHEVVEETMQYIGKAPSFVVGAPNRRALGFASRVLPRKMTVKAIGDDSLKNWLHGKNPDITVETGK